MQALRPRRFVERALALLLVGVLALGALPAAHAQEEGGYAHGDPAGDVFVFGMQAPATLPSVPPTAPFDLTEFRIFGEDEIGLTLQIKVVSLKGDAALPFIYSETLYTVRGKLEGTTVTYRLEFYVTPPQVGTEPSGVRDVYTRLCVNPGGDGGSGGGGGNFFISCTNQRVRGTADFDNGLLQAYVTKDALVGRAPVEGSAPLSGIGPITKNMRLADLYVSVQRFFPTPWSDRLPNEGVLPPYLFQSDAANGKVRIGLDRNTVEGVQGDGDRGGGPQPPGDGGGPANNGEVSVTPGVPTLVRLRVENENAGKRFVNLSASLLPPASPGKWAVQVAPAISVPGGESRVVNLIVNATPTVQHRETAEVVVRGQSLGFPDELAALRLTLVASVPPGPSRQTLYFHAAQGEDAGTLDALCIIFFCFDRQATWSNTLQEDSLANLDDGFHMDMMGFGFGNVAYSARFPLDTPLAQAVVLDANKSIEAELVFKPVVEFSGSVSLEVTTSMSGRLIAGGSYSGTIGTAVIPLSFLPLADAVRVTPEDGRLELRLTVRTQTTGAGATSLLPDFQFVPKRSSVTFPFIPDPNAGDIRVSLGPAFIGLSLQTDPQEFLNPGRGKIFNATVVNEGIEADEAKLEILYDQPNWRVDVLPGIRYNLPPGDNARFSLLVRAPADAKEGDQLHILVNATSHKDPNVRSQIRLTAIVTTGIDIPDETRHFKTDEESAQKVVRPPSKNTPGPTAVLGALAILGFGAWSRRRRGDA